MNARAMLATSMLLARVTVAQQPSTPESNEGSRFRVRSNLVFLPTRVETKRGDTIYGLSSDDFIVEDNGLRRVVQVDDSPSDALSLVVAIQCGRSAVAEFKTLKGLATMIEEIVGSATHEVAIVAYGERPYLLSDFSPNLEVTRIALSRLKSCGDYHAAAIDAVHYSLGLLEHRQNKYRRAILLIGEERDHGSRSKLHEVIGELGETNTVIYTIAFSPTKNQFLSELRYGPNGPPKSEPPPVVYPTNGKTRPAMPEARKDQFEEPKYTDHAPLFTLPPLLFLALNALRDNTAAELASLSGGEYMNFVAQRGFERALQRVSNQVHNYYLLSFQADSSDELEHHSIRVSVAGRPDAIIQTRKSYWSGTPSVVSPMQRTMRK